MISSGASGFFPDAAARDDCLTVAFFTSLTTHPVRLNVGWSERNGKVEKLSKEEYIKVNETRLAGKSPLFLTLAKGSEAGPGFSDNIGNQQWPAGTRRAVSSSPRGAQAREAKNKISPGEISFLPSGLYLVTGRRRNYLMLLDPLLHIRAENSPVSAPTNAQFKTRKLTFLEQYVHELGVAMQVFRHPVQRHDIGPDDLGPCATAPTFGLLASHFTARQSRLREPQRPDPR
jgi:hypothetical protein